MQTKTVIPLFPLPVSACPGEVLPLHVFEPRYRDLIEWCRTEQAEGRSGEFGILFKCRGPMAQIGSTVRLSRILRTEEDGRMDILVSGIRRFRMVKALHLHSYDSAEIEVVEDEAGDWNEAHATEVYQLHRTLLSSITGKLPEDQMYAGKHLLSFVVMPSSGLTADEKQELLEMTSEDARLESLSRHYKALLGAVEYVQMAGRSIQAWCDLKDFLTARRDEDSNGWKP